MGEAVETSAVAPKKRRRRAMNENVFTPPTEAEVESEREAAQRNPLQLGLMPPPEHRNGIQVLSPEQRAALATATRVEVLLLGQIFESSTNPRKVFGDMTELVASVKAKGVLQPVLVRPDPLGSPHYELVAGARRFRACIEAGIATIPALIRPLTDVEALECQVIENNQRSDVHPLEEADGFAMLRDRHGYSAESIADRIGRSKGYVYQRLKLVELCEKGRESFLAGNLPAASALLVARLPAPDQPAALKAMQDWHGEPLSARQAAEEMRRRFYLPLAEAGFDVADAELVPAAGSCTACPKRTGKQAELFGNAEQLDQDLCTDRACLAKKRDADWARRTKAAKTAGIAVLKGPEAREALSFSSDWLDLDAEDRGSSGKATTWRKSLGKNVPEVTLMRDAYGRAHELVPRKQVFKLLQRDQYGSKKSPSSTTSGSGSEARAVAEQQLLEKKVKERAIAALVAGVETEKPTVELWRLLVAGAVKEVWSEFITATSKGRGFESSEDLLAAIPTMTEKPLRGLLFELLFRRYGLDDPTLKSAIALYQIDLGSIRSEVKAVLKASGKGAKRG